MEYLVESNKAIAGDAVPNQITADGQARHRHRRRGHRAPTASARAHRQGALSVTNLAIGQQPGRGAPGAPALADDADDLRSAVRARRGRRTPTIWHPPWSSSPNDAGRGACAARRRDRVRRRSPRAQERHGARDTGRSGADRNGVHRARSATALDRRHASAGRRARCVRARRRSTNLDRPGRVRRRGCRAADSRSLSGRSPRVALRPRVWTVI